MNKATIDWWIKVQKTFHWLVRWFINRFVKKENKLWNILSYTNRWGQMYIPGHGNSGQVSWGLNWCDKMIWQPLLKPGSSLLLVRLKVFVCTLSKVGAQARPQIKGVNDVESIRDLAASRDLDYADVNVVVICLGQTGAGWEKIKEVMWEEFSLSCPCADREKALTPAVFPPPPRDSLLPEYNLPSLALLMCPWLCAVLWHWPPLMAQSARWSASKQDSQGRCGLIPCS